MKPQARVFEVGPRDGLQNEPALLPVEQKVELIHRLIEAGARDIEVGSFVHPRWIPQLADTEEVVRRLSPHPGVRYWALVPNMRGMERALSVGITHAAFFLSASETHNRKNVNRSIDESLEDLVALTERAGAEGMTTRAYISMVFGCPFEGDISFDRVMDMAHRVRALGVDIVSLGDTVGYGTPLQMREDCARAVRELGAEHVALHLHDTRGMGITNAFVAWEAGMRLFDSSVGGIGGCPYAPGAAGNIGSEDLVYLMNSLGVHTGLSLDQLSQTALWLQDHAQITIPSRCSRYMQASGHSCAPIPPAPLPQQS